MYNAIFSPSAELCFDTVMPDLSKLQAVVAQAQAGAGVCIDLSRVAHCDSAGLALLIEAKRLCERSGRSFEIRNMPNQIRALAEFCGVQSLWSMG